MNFVEAVELVKECGKIAAIRAIRLEIHSGLAETIDFVNAVCANEDELEEKWQALSYQGGIQKLIKQRFEEELLATQAEALAEQAKSVAEAHRQEVILLQSQINHLLKNNGYLYR